MSGTRDWDATTYDRISGPQQLWAAEQLDGLALRGDTAHHRIVRSDCEGTRGK